MSDRFIKIVGFGLIGTDKENGPYRQIIVRDEKNGQQAELHISKKEKPMLWADVEKMEKGGVLPPYRGFITQLNNINVIVFGDENVDEAYMRQMKHFNVKAKISLAEANAMREKSLGYITNFTKEGCMEIAWQEINANANVVKFRAYAGKGKFVWGNWYEIKQ